MEEIKAAARKSGLFIVTDSDLAFNNPVIRVDIDRSKANDLGITMAAIGDTLATMVGGNYVNRFNLDGRSYEVIPQVPRVGPADAGEPAASTTSRRAPGEPVPLSTVVTHRDRHGAQRADPVQPAQLGHLLGRADAGRHHGPGGRRSSSSRRQRCCRPTSSTPTCRTRGSTCTEGNQLAVTFVFALIVIFLVLAAQFESLRDPFVILVSVPMSICGALLPLFFGLGTLEHLHPDRAGDADRADQQARHPDGRVRQRAAAQREPRPARGDRARGPGAAAPDPDDHGGHGGRPVPAAGRQRRRRRQPVRDRAGHRRRAC